MQRNGRLLVVRGALGSKKSSGAREITNGWIYVSAALENNQWRLCHSDFIPSQGFPTLGIR